MARAMSVPAATVKRSLTRANVRVKFDATRISPFGTEWTTPSLSRTTVRRRPTSSTVPRIPASATTSPTLNGFSPRISDAVEVVADQLLGAEAERRADGRAERDAERAEPADHLRGERRDRGDPR